MTVDSKTEHTDSTAAPKVSINTFTNNSVEPSDVVKHGSKMDGVIWLVSIVSLVAATLVNKYLPQYWALASSSVWVRVAVIVALIAIALAGLYNTHQGKGLIRLLKDARTELYRITWPEKQDTVRTAGVVMVVVFIMSILLWLIDTFFSWIIKSIVG